MDTDLAAALDGVLAGVPGGDLQRAAGPKRSGPAYRAARDDPWPPEADAPLPSIAKL